MHQSTPKETKKERLFIYSGWLFFYLFHLGVLVIAEIKLQTAFKDTQICHGPHIICLWARLKKIGVFILQSIEIDD